VKEEDVQPASEADAGQGDEPEAASDAEKDKLPSDA